jgi:phosphohistidine phosphatase
MTMAEERKPTLPRLELAGAVPFRVAGRKVEFLLVTSHRGNWIFPKGIIEPGDSPEGTALKEAREEAGILGHLLPEPIGSYEDRKWQCDCTVDMFLVEYAGECAAWEEGGLRRRLWCTYEEARRLLKKPEVRAILEQARARLDR